MTIRRIGESVFREHFVDSAAEGRRRALRNLPKITGSETIVGTITCPLIVRPYTTPLEKEKASSAGQEAAAVDRVHTR